jgi:hypothetical protein
MISDAYFRVRSENSEMYRLQSRVRLLEDMLVSTAGDSPIFAPYEITSEISSINNRRKCHRAPFESFLTKNK